MVLILFRPMGLGIRKGTGEKKNLLCCICTMSLFLSQINNLPSYNEVRHRQLFFLIEGLVWAQKTADIKPTVYNTQMYLPSFCLFHKELQDTWLERVSGGFLVQDTYPDQVKELAAWTAVEQPQSRKGLYFVQVEFHLFEFVAIAFYSVAGHH